jgi:hypothetical protein
MIIREVNNKKQKSETFKMLALMQF